MKPLGTPDAVDFTCVDTVLKCGRQNVRPTERVTHHPHMELNLITNGSVTYMYGGNETQVVAGSLVAFWSAIPHQIVGVTRDARYFALTVPLDWILQCRLPEAFTHRILDGQILVDPQINERSDVGMFERWVRDLRSCQASSIRIVMREVEARLLRFAESLPGQRQSTENRSSASPTCELINAVQVRQMLCLIAQNYTGQITLEFVSKSIGVHPRYMISLFRKALGTTFLHYVTRLRMSHAQQLLVTSSKKIIDVAFESGFNSLSRFNEVFKEACGCCPCEYRERFGQVGNH